MDILLFTLCCLTCWEGVQSVDSDVAMLLWSTTNGNIYQVSGDPYDWAFPLGDEDNLRITESSLASERHIAAMDFHYADSQLYLYSPDITDIAMLSTASTGHNLTRVEQLNLPCSDQVTGLSIDWTANNIYWTDAVYNWVMMTSLSNLGHRRAIIEDGLQNPSDVVVNPKAGYLFFSDSSLPSIERTDLSGQDRTPLVQSGLVRPTSLALDFMSNRLYWLDSGQGSIKSIMYDGKDTDTLADSKDVLSFVAISIFKELLFAAWTLDPKVDAFDLRKDKSLGTKVTLARTHQVTDILMYSQTQQEVLSTPCEHARCQHLCVGGPNNLQPICLCSEGHVADGDKCIGHGSFQSHAYLYITDNSVCEADVFAPFTTSSNDRCFPLGNNVDEIRAVAFHWKSQSLFLAERGQKSIRTLSLKDFSLKTNIQGVENVGGMVVDWVSNHLYWTNTELGKIIVSILDGFLVSKTLMTNLTSPGAIAIDIKLRLLFWVEAGSSIYSCGLDGGAKRMIVGPSSGHRPSKIKVDTDSRLLLWLNDGDKSIYRVSLDSVDSTPVVVLVLDYVQTITAFDVFKDFLVWTSSTESPLALHIVNTGNMKDTVKMIEADSINDVISFGRSLQPTIQNECSFENGGCDQFCFVTSDSQRVCACGEGYQLNEDFKSCRNVLSSPNSTEKPSTPPGIVMYAGIGAGAAVFIIVVIVIAVVCAKKKRKQEQQRNNRRKQSLADLKDLVEPRRPSVDRYNIDNTVFGQSSHPTQDEVYDEIDDHQVDSDYLEAKQAKTNRFGDTPAPDYHMDITEDYMTTKQVEDVPTNPDYHNYTGHEITANHYT